MSKICKILLIFEILRSGPVKKNKKKKEKEKIGGSWTMCDFTALAPGKKRPKIRTTMFCGVLSHYVCILCQLK
jgi:hypothetical protein